MFKVEEKLADFIKKHILLICVVLTTLAAMYVRYKMLNYESGDFIYFLKPWFEYLKTNGGLYALKSYPGDYNAPYMTLLALLTYLPFSGIKLIKGLSIIFDIVLAISGAAIVKELTKDKTKAFVAYMILLLVPAVVLNSAMWGQCDSIYTSFVLLSILFLLKKKYIKSFVLLGLAFSFKLQFIFIIPLYILYYLSEKKFSILNFLIIPFVNCVLCLPAILFGKPIVETLLIYANQTSTYKDSLTLNFPNIYNFINVSKEQVDMMYKYGIVLTMILFALLAIYFIVNKVKLNNEKVMLTAILSTVIATYFLPGMHERYLFAGEIIIIIYYISYRKYLPLFIMAIIAPLYTYSLFLWGAVTDYMPYLCIAYLFSLIVFVKDSLITLKSKQNL